MTEESKISMINAGYDFSGALARFVGNEDLYLMFLKKYPDDANWVKIKPALDARDVKEAFSAAHAFKGIAGNLGLTDVFEDSKEFLEVLRPFSKEDGAVDETIFNKALELYDIMVVKHEKACEIIKGLE